jgi:hypothetical protein
MPGPARDIMTSSGSREFEGDRDGDMRPSSECEAMWQALRERLLSGSLPPDDAYWWTRIIAEEVGGFDAR